jgi:DNA-binding beta-propeller fold protein YncE
MKTLRILSAAVGVLALASTAAAQLPVNVNPTWKINADSATIVLSKTWFTGNTDPNLTRGMAYNPATGNLLVVDRGPSNTIYVISAATGADVGSLNGSGISGGGGAALNKIGVAADGAIFLCNLDTLGNFKVYRWASENDGLTTGGNQAPTLAYEQAVVDPTDDLREGDGFAVFGAGVNTKLVAAGNSGQLSIFTTTNGLTFTRTLLTPAPAITGSSQHVTWDPSGDFIWWRNPGVSEVRKIDATTGASISFTGDGNARGGIAVANGAFGVNSRVYVSGIGNIGAGNTIVTVNFYEIADSTVAGALPTATYALANPGAGDSLTLQSTLANGNGSGEAIYDATNNRVYHLYTNNAITAYQLPAPLSVEDWSLLH